MDSYAKSFKVVLLGEGAVGKTSLMLRYTENKFINEHISTIQAAFASKHLIVDNERVELAIWDTAGQERFHALGPIYYRDSHGALLVYDITDRRSFERVKKWVEELLQMLGDTVVLFVVGNKIDLESSRVVSVEEAAKGWSDFLNFLIFSQLPILFYFEFLDTAQVGARP
uniref:Ras-related protein Rab-21 n=1 Tax=Meloidogyne incognita TaxID=6306 RepID=A0A914KWZ6_MELIC